MGKIPDKYKLEVSLSKFLYKAGDYLFEIPKDKMNRISWIIEIICFSLLGISIILRAGG